MFPNEMPCEICGRVPPEGFQNSWGPLAQRLACNDCLVKSEQSIVGQSLDNLDDVVEAMKHGYGNIMFVINTEYEDTLPEPSEN